MQYVYVRRSVTVKMKFVTETTMRTKLIVTFALALLPVLAISNVIAGNSSRSSSRPYRVLVVTGNQWNDPGSYRIDEQTQLGNRRSGSNKDFRDVITMLNKRHRRTEL